MDHATPLVNSGMLPNYTGQTVRVIGKVQRIQGDKMILQTSDQGVIEVSLQSESIIPEQGEGFYEVTGKVAGSGDALREFASINFGNDIDMALVEKVINVSLQYPDIFTDQS